MEKCIAVVDAVSGHTIDATLSLEARGTSVKNRFVTIKCNGDLILGRVGDVALTNQVHQNDTFAPYIMTHGFVPHWSGEVDIERAKISVLCLIDDATGNRIPLRRNPPTGTAIMPATQEMIDKFTNDSDHMLIIGEIPNSGGIRASVINRNFGPYDKGGYGEARHTGIFGQNGSGKTVAATMLIAGKLAANPQMGLIMPDSAGDLSDPTRHNRGDFHWNFVEVLKVAGVLVDIISVSDIRLSSRTTLKGKLRPLLKECMSMGDDKAYTLSERVVESLFSDKVTSADITPDAIIGAIVDQIGSCYARASRNEKTEDAEHLRDTPARRRPFESGLNRIRELFDGRLELGYLIKDILERGKKVVIQMDESQIRSSDQDFVMREVMLELSKRAKIVYRDKKASCNALVVLDEGQRWVPEGSGPDVTEISGIISQAFRSTRKYGLGWMIVAQRPSGISKAVLAECHTKWFGRSLGVGSDAKHLEDCLGKEGVEAYNQLSIQGGYFWVGFGLDNNVGTEGTHFAVHPFSGDATTAFIKANPQIFHQP